MEIKDAKEILSPNEWLKNNYPNNKEYNWNKYKEVFMQQYAEYYHTKKITEFKKHGIIFFNKKSKDIKNAAKLLNQIANDLKLK